MVETVKTIFFSVIMPAFNAERFIAQAILSVQKQSFTKWELIIINDGSTDGTLNIIKRYQAEDRRIQVIYQANKKQGAARNAGIRVAQGTWIAFLDADDEWLPEKLAYQYQVIQENQGCQVISTSGYTRFNHEPVKPFYHFAFKSGCFQGHEMYALEMFNNYIPILSVVVERTMIDKVGLFNESPDVQGCEDHDYWLRLARAGAVFLNDDQRMFIYHIHSGNTSNQHEKQHFMSADIRLNNFDRNLLTLQQCSDFAQEIQKFISFFRARRKSEYADILAEKLRKLEIKSQQPYYNFPGLTGIVKKSSKQIVKGLLKTILFPLKKTVGKYNLRLASEYQRWLHHSNLKIKGPVKISPKAKLEFLHDHAQIITYGMQVGDFSYLNLTTEKSELVTGSGFIINRFCHFNILGKVVVGSNVLFNNYCTLNCFDSIEIGDNSWFGESVKFYDHNHQYKDKNIPFTSQGYTTGKIKIGSNVWVGSNTVILQNVSIGDNCVIGANNIIYRSVPADTIMKSGQVQNY
jgi:teichuronic acid biosynthesis glycosyltransferase TuaG